MKILGTSSMASFLEAVLDIAWYGGIVVAALLLAFFFYALWNPAAEVEDAYLKVPCRLTALDIDPAKLPDDPYQYVDPHLVTHDPSVYGYNLRGTVTQLRFRTHNRFNLALYLTLSSIWIAIYLCILFNLRRIFMTLRDGHPFVLENALRLRRVGLAVCLMHPLSWILLWVLDVLVVRGKFSVLGEPVATAIFSREFLPVIFLGLVVLVIAEIVRIGVATKEGYEDLRREQELTV